MSEFWWVTSGVVVGLVVGAVGVVWYLFMQRRRYFR